MKQHTELQWSDSCLESNDARRSDFPEHTCYCSQALHMDVRKGCVVQQAD